MDEEIKRKILTLLDQHRIMTIATLRPDGWPQATTVGYVNEGPTLYFICGLNSQKAEPVLCHRMARGGGVANVAKLPELMHHAHPRLGVSAAQPRWKGFLTTEKHEKVLEKLAISDKATIVIERCAARLAATVEPAVECAELEKKRARSNAIIRLSVRRGDRLAQAGKTKKIVGR